jgi:NADP-dependent 3-hydroxy acid dehydrogenase YdfG
MERRTPCRESKTRSSQSRAQSSEIGKETALLLAERGAKVVLRARGSDSLPEVKAQLEASRDKFAMPPDAIARAIAFATEQPADVDVSEIIVRPTAQG